MSAYAQNKKAWLNYEILEEFEGGLMLKGFEVKAIKDNRANLEGSYVIIRGGEAYLVGASISPYQANNTPENYDPAQARKILVTKKELLRLQTNDAKKGLTLVPLSLYNKGNKVKLGFALARGKKDYDKREDMKKKEAKRDIERTLKYRK